MWSSRWQCRLVARSGHLKFRKNGSQNGHFRLKIWRGQQRAGYWNRLAPSEPGAQNECECVIAPEEADREMSNTVNRIINLKTILSIIIAMIITHVFAIYYGLYSGDVWIDMPLHFVGGFLAGMVGYWAMGFRVIGEKFGEPNLLTICFILISVSLFGSFIWELFEFGLLNCCESWARAGRLISPTVPDLLSDMALGLTGGIVFVVVLVFGAARKP